MVVIMYERRGLRIYNLYFYLSGVPIPFLLYFDGSTALLDWVASLERPSRRVADINYTNSISSSLPPASSILILSLNFSRDARVTSLFEVFCLFSGFRFFS